ncbi:DNA polymerase III subunit beta [Fusobacterium ulcerans]|uniref:Beta sliding clamp n=2 Tax=Fusobacterium ulcerans TaxID=861 RepID=A0AAX1TQI1_9FUSO|nr:DNA polymerase III subunit beta [Fusobacterium ulcerans]AVQ28420.1 DNA polymerase III subunit beta [Fusobacterium ulcerans]EFS25886.1 DNA polymerase III, beta subunit [Fusobacterium ulcerans ATCC 49185]EHO78445.1 DNA polymerase III, beta subunit [Fusobacterium ulcerans 12-1B]MCB8564930.1 DNA polymerase III subunit beta [Fusobacterium ulcerans]MCB8650361.1 DNA polymerase III subunit beta [Fusobacterium ulcerans]
MIVKLKRQDFLKRLKIVEKAINENKIKPIISCAYIETRGENLFFCGTNLETTITTEMKCEEIVEEGRIVFQHQLVDEYLREIKDEIVTLSVRDNNLFIESSDSSSEFSLMEAEDFPKILVEADFFQRQEDFKMNSVELADIFEKVKFAASTSSDNLSINCVRLESEVNNLKFITTDTYRLVFLEKELEKVNEKLEVSIPLNTIEALTKLLRSIEETEIKFYFYNKQVYFKLEDTLIISRVIDLAFPNYKGILGNNTYNKTLLINSEKFLKVLRRIIIFVRNNAESKYGATFELEGKDLKVNGVNDIAKINEQLEVEYEGDRIKISLNAKFLSDFIQNLNKESNIMLNFISSNGSVKIKKENDDNYLYIVMPLALKD